MLRPGACALACALLAACSHAGNAAGGDAGSGSVDSFDAGDDAPDWSNFCTGSLPDAGFSSLADLPIGRLCAESFENEVSESKLTCQGYRLVGISDGIDCGGWWLFEASTGALVATGGGCNTSIACTGAVPGFVFPYQCFVNGGWPQAVDLCPEAGIADAAFDTPD